jgi:uncharacterized iron-regulated protein
MPRASPSPRNQLIAIQRRIVERLRQEIFASLGDLPAELEEYRREYEQSFRGFQRLVRPERFLARLAAADVVFQGDFHTLRECQRSALRILRELTRRRSVVLAVEMITLEHQPQIDAYIAGELEERAFLEAVEYEENWGFDWASYRPLFELARERELQVYGINCRGGPQGPTLRWRAKRAAEVVARAALAHPESLVYVIAGDFHVCRSHLPAAVERRLAAEGTRRQQVLIHQNIDDFYWDLARRRLEHRAQVLEIGPDEFCLMNSTPLVKYQSYLHWEQGQEEILEGVLSCGRAANAEVAEELQRLLEAMCEFLEIEANGLDDFTVFTASDLDFLSALGRRGSFSRRDLREIKRQLLDEESYFITGGNIIYLSSLSIDHAAEEAAHYLNNKLAGHLRHPLPARRDFYYRTLREALGFFGSKVVNPPRFHYGEAELREICAEQRGRGATGAMGRVLAVARHVLRHIEAERRFLACGRRPHLRAIYRQEIDLHRGITHTLGYILGDRLYRAVLSGRMERREVRQLFRERLEGERDAEMLYFELVRKLRE